MGAVYKKSLDGRQVMCIKLTSSAAVAAGDIVSVANGKVAPLAAAGTGIMGIACNTVAAADGEVQVQVITDASVIRVPYVGATKTTLAVADLLGTKFDWDATNKKVNLDDTIGGMFRVLSYDNTDKTADVLISGAALWNA